MHLTTISLCNWTRYSYLFEEYLCTSFGRAQVERLQSKLQSFESMNEALSATVMSLEAQLREMGHERDELRSMNESSSAQLRRALEVHGHAFTCSYSVHVQQCFIWRENPPSPPPPPPPIHYSVLRYKIEIPRDYTLLLTWGVSGWGVMCVILVISLVVSEHS